MRLTDELTDAIKDLIGENKFDCAKVIGDIVKGDRLKTVIRGALKPLPGQPVGKLSQ